MTVTFTDFGLVPELHAALNDVGYTTPTPIQAAAVPLALEGRDVIGIAATGTGKTAAFLLPLMSKLYPGDRGRTRALILSPTRELAMQIDEAGMALSWHTGLSVACVVGGVNFGPQEDALRAGAEIVVATPGRLVDHLRFDHIDLSGVEVLVLDEADRMLDMGFLPDLKRIVAAIPADRQTLLFSATMAGEVRKFADAILRDPVMVQVDRPRPSTSLTHRVIAVPEAHKTDLLCQLLRHPTMTSVIVFVNRKRDADGIARAVRQAGMSAESIHADRKQEQRTAAMEAFRKGEVTVLVATDVAARGIDVDGVSHVIHYNVPLSTEDFVHRSGRTGRAGATGWVVTLVDAEEDWRVAQIEKESGITLPRASVKGFAPRPRAARPATRTRSSAGRGRPSGGRSGGGGRGR